MSDEDIARQITSNPDAAPDMAPEIDVPAIRWAARITEAQFAAAYGFSVLTVQEWERGRETAERSGSDATAGDQGDPEGLRRALSRIRGGERLSGPKRP